MNEKPLVSVIIPVYNAEAWLRECLDSLLRQTFRDFEILCVDDGSSDGSHAILQEYAVRDERVSILQQDHAGAGAARNLGISRSRGKYLLFLDADDRFLPEMLHSVYDQTEKTDAEICVFGADGFDTKTGKSVHLPAVCAPRKAQGAVFSRRDDPDGIFCFTNPAPWNKLFRSSLITEKGLSFLCLPNANDLTFVFSALAAAERITTLPKPLLQYRMGNQTSVQGSKSRAPLAFYDALLELRKRLQEMEIYAELERAFVNQAAAVTFYNLLNTQPKDTFASVYAFVRDTVLDELTLKDRPAGYYFQNPRDDYPGMIRVMTTETMEAFIDRYGPEDPPTLRGRLRKGRRKLLSLLGK